MLQLILLGAALAAPAGAHPSDCVRDGLAGPVHTVVTKIQIVQTDVHGNPDTSQLLAGEDTYDRACNLVESKEYKGDFVDDQHFTRVDAETLLVRSNMGDRTIHERYDANGRLTETRITRADGGFVEHSLFAYDANGCETRVDSFDAAGKPYGFTVLTCDAAGHAVRQVLTFGDGRSQTSVFSYRFDKRGNWIEQFDSENDPDNPAKPIQPSDILFRTITYYDVTARRTSPISAVVSLLRAPSAASRRVADRRRRRCRGPCSDVR